MKYSPNLTKCTLIIKCTLYQIKWFVYNKSHYLVTWKIILDPYFKL